MTTFLAEHVMVIRILERQPLALRRHKPIFFDFKIGFTRSILLTLIYHVKTIL